MFLDINYVEDVPGVVVNHLRENRKQKSFVSPLINEKSNTKKSQFLMSSVDKSTKKSKQVISKMSLLSTSINEAANLR